MPEMSSDRTRMLRENSSMAVAQRPLVDDELDEIGAHGVADHLDRARSAGASSVAKASRIRSHQVAVRRSMTRSTSRHVLAGEDAARAAAAHGDRLGADAGQEPRLELLRQLSSGAASRTSAAIWAAASRSFSQLRRKLATDGT